MSKSSGFYSDYKQVVQKNYDYAKKKKQETGRQGIVFPKTIKPLGNT